MKKFAKLFGIIVLTTVIGFSFAACDNSGGSSEEPSLRAGTITITGIPPHFNGMYAYFEADNRDAQDIRVMGIREQLENGWALVQIRNGSVTLPMWHQGGPVHGQAYSGNHTFSTPPGTDTSGNRVRMTIMDIPNTDWDWDDATWDRHFVNIFRIPSITFQNGGALLAIPTITITGLAAYNGQRASVNIRTQTDGGNVAQGGWGWPGWPRIDVIVSNGRVTLPLRTYAGGDRAHIWTGRGSHHIIMHFGPPNGPHTSTFWYTSGRTWDEITVNDVVEIPRRNITSATTTLHINQFQQGATVWN